MTFTFNYKNKTVVCDTTYSRWEACATAIIDRITNGLPNARVGSCFYN